MNGIAELIRGADPAGRLASAAPDARAMADLRMIMSGQLASIQHATVPSTPPTQVAPPVRRSLLRATAYVASAAVAASAIGIAVSDRPAPAGGGRAAPSSLQSTGTPAPSESDTSDLSFRPWAGSAALEILGETSATASLLYYPHSITSAMPSTLFQTSSGLRPFTEIVVVGQFTKWSASADGKRMSADFSVQEVVDEVADTAAIPARVRVELNLASNRDFDGVGLGLLDLGRLVLFLSSDGPHRTDVYRIGLDGAFLGLLDERDDIRWPLIQHGTAENHGLQFLIDVTTLEELRQAAARPTRIVEVEEP